MEFILYSYVLIVVKFMILFVELVINIDVFYFYWFFLFIRWEEIIKEKNNDF